MKKINHIIYLISILLFFSIISGQFAISIEENPPDPPEIITESQVIYHQNITIEWNSVPLAESYIIYINSTENSTTLSTFHNLTLPQTGIYHIAVSAVNIYGESDLSEEVNITVILTPPSAPIWLSTNRSYDYPVVSVIWKPTAYSDNYTLFINNVFNRTCEMPNTVIDFQLPGQYFLHLQANNVFGHSSNSSTLSVSITLPIPSNSSVWSIDSLHIDPTGVRGNGTWEDFLGEPWCSGAGTINNPYIVENLFIESPTMNFGILIENSEDLHFMLKNCTVINNHNQTNFTGIRLFNSSNGTLCQNTIIDCWIGIELRECREIELFLNDVTNQTFSSKFMEWTIGGFYGLLLNASSYCELKSNNLSNQFVGIALQDCMQNYLTDNHMNTCYIGILFNSADYNLIKSNLIYSPINVGCSSHSSTNNNYSENQILGTSEFGILLISQSSNTSLYNNTISANLLAMRIENSNNVSLIHNRLYSASSYSMNFSMSEDITMIGNIIQGTMYSDIEITIQNIRWNVWDGIISHPITIDDENHGEYTWDDANHDMAWISGQGTFENPYRISNITFSLTSSYTALKISRSNCPFVVEYCHFLNSDDYEYQDGLILVLVSAGNIKNNIFGQYFTDGIEVRYCNDILISQNQFLGGPADHGLYLYNSTYITIEENHFYNLKDGINVGTLCSNFTIRSNNFEQCHRDALQLYEETSFNMIYKNQFKNNTVHAIDNGLLNQWYYDGIGNFWDNYTGIDENEDGIGDTPYHEIYGIANATDPYPIWDFIPPTITILNPTSHQLFGSDTPEFTVVISDLRLDTMWYTIDGGMVNHTFLSNGTIDEIQWNNLPACTSILLEFFANDTAGLVQSQSVLIYKDVLSPTLEVISPLNGSEYSETPPDFEIIITEANLAYLWYSVAIDGSDEWTIPRFFTNNGTLDQDLWDSYGNATLLIRFSANDTIGNSNHITITIVKVLDANPPDETITDTSSTSTETSTTTTDPSITTTPSATTTPTEQNRGISGYSFLSLIFICGLSILGYILKYHPKRE